MLPDDRAATLIEVFDVLQRLRLRYQLRQYQAGERPTDVVTLKWLSPMDRSVIAQAVREISAVQRRMDNMSHYVAVRVGVAGAGLNGLCHPDGAPPPTGRSVGGGVAGRLSTRGQAAPGVGGLGSR